MPTEQRHHTMFAFWHLRNVSPESSWHALVPDFETSTDEFYRTLREAVAARRIPDLEIGEIEFREGGPLSAGRRYLRIRRERLVFDVCSAPFGTSWFFSCRYGEIPVRIRPWEAVAMLAASAGLVLLHVSVFGPVAGPVVFALNVVAFLFLANGLLATGLYGLDAVLLKIPALGKFYERFLRADSYFRDDSRQMYRETVDALVRRAVEEAAGAKVQGGVRFRGQYAISRLGILGRIREGLKIPWAPTNSG